LTPPTQAFDISSSPFYLQVVALSPFESRLHSALADYLDTVGQGRAESPHPDWAEKLKTSMHTLDTLESELSSQLDPRLRHFLESKSYRKAHEHLSALSSAGLANPPTTRQACSQ
jgi:hypothetical protein